MCSCSAMNKKMEQQGVHKLAQALTFGLLLVGLFYVGYMNETLKGVIPEVHRAVLVIGFMIGVAATSSYLGVALAKRLTQKNPTRGR
jgi:hypothetical protein